MTPPAPPITLWLSFHVDYACRHSGACCRAGWPLPVETAVVAPIEAAVAGGRIVTVDGSPIWLRETAEAPEGTAGTFRLVSNACVFHVPRTSGGPGASDRHCAVHATLGHEALPSSCQHFPRVCLVDDRGVRVSLSNFCPTAAAMLVDDQRPVAIVAGPPAVPGVVVPEGLDARDQVPPRLTDRVLMDLAALTAWEAHVVLALAGPDRWSGPVEAVLAHLARQAARLVRWTPAEGTTLVDAIRDLAAPDSGVRHVAAAGWTAAAAIDLAQSACRPPWTWPAPPADLAALDAACVAPRWREVAPVVGRYLSGKAFASWIPYQADAAGSLVSGLSLALAVLRVECARACESDRRLLDRDCLMTAIRQADLLLAHYADGAALATALARS